jgi:hypothetical protein
MLPAVGTKNLIAPRRKEKFFLLRTWRPLRLCARRSFSDLFFIQKFKYIWQDFGLPIGDLMEIGDATVVGPQTSK